MPEPDTAAAYTSVNTTPDDYTAYQRHAIYACHYLRLAEPTVTGQQWSASWTAAARVHALLALAAVQAPPGQGEGQQPAGMGALAGWV